MWTVEKLTALCIEYCGRCNVEFNVPVIINPRTVSTLGSCWIRKTFVNGSEYWKPTKVEFSKTLLSVASEEDVKAVIAHECAHYVTAAITHKDHGHDATFRFYCSKIGTDNSSAHSNLDSYKENCNQIFKYTFFCSKCGKFLGGRTRTSKIVKNIQLYSSKCCEASVNVIQNW